MFGSGVKMILGTFKGDQDVVIISLCLQYVCAMEIKQEGEMLSCLEFRVWHSLGLDIEVLFEQV